MLGPAGRLEGLRDRVAEWAATKDRRRSTAARRAVRDRWPRDGGVPRQRAAQLAGRRRRRDRGEIAVADASASKVFASDAGAVRSGWRSSASCTAYGDPADPETADADALPRRAGQAEPRAHLRRRRQRGAARADRDVRARACRRCRDDVDAAVDQRPVTTGSWPRPSGSRRSARPSRRLARDPVNQPTINNWLEAMGDDQPALHARARRRRRWPRSGRCTAWAPTRAAERPARTDDARCSTDEGSPPCSAPTASRPTSATCGSASRSRVTTALESVVGPEADRRWARATS